MSLTQCYSNETWAVLRGIPSLPLLYKEGVRAEKMRQDLRATAA